MVSQVFSGPETNARAAQSDTQRGRLSQGHALVATLGGALSLAIPACAPALQFDLASTKELLVATLPSERIILFERLDQIDKKLCEINRMKGEAMLKYGWLLLLPEINERYSSARRHHAELIQQTRSFKVALMAEDAPCEEITTWAEQISDSLEKVSTFIAYIKEHHVVPSGWVPPAGFEYLRTLGS